MTSVGLSDILIGLPTDRYLPRVGWSTSTIVPVLRSDSSSAISFIDRIGPHGMSYWLRISIASYFVFVIVHFSMRAKIGFRCSRRAAGVLYASSVIQLSSPMTLHTAGQTAACVMK